MTSYSVALSVFLTFRIWSKCLLCEDLCAVKLYQFFWHFVETLTVAWKALMISIVS